MSEKVLVVDDEKEIRMLIRACLEKEGFRVVEAASGKEALELFDQTISLILLDVMMPENSGIFTCISIRQKSHVPIIFLTAKTRESDVVIGLSAGADDYITKPFTPSILVARVKANIRRQTFLKSADGNTSSDEIIRIKDLCINEKSRQVFCGDEEVSFTRTEFDILLMLALHVNQVFSIEKIYEYVWGDEFFDSSSNTVMVHIKKLRKKLEKVNRNYEYIKTVWGVGYKIES